MKKKILSVREIALFAMLGAVAFASQVVLEVLPNIHLTAMILILCTVLFRKKALIPLYLYVFLIGVRWGFGVAWLPYLYIWLPLWGAAMLVSSKWNRKIRMVLYSAIGLLHGLLFGVLYAPAQAILFGFSFRQTLLWISAGLLWDLVHGLGNAVVCTLVLPLERVLKKLL
jgi:energy-coupling factor transport system substrate-specific component